MEYGEGNTLVKIETQQEKKEKQKIKHDLLLRNGEDDGDTGVLK